MAKQTKTEAEAVVAEQQEEGGLLSQILNEGLRVRDDAQAKRGQDMIASFVEQVMQGTLTMSKDMEATINARIAEIDRLMSAQLNEIMHHEEFQRLEASWRGLHHLVFETKTIPMLKIRVMNVKKRELLKDLEKAIEFDQSALFKKIYEEEYGTFGGAPFGAMIGDYYFSNHPEDMLLLQEVSQVAADAPFISSAAPQLFGWDNMTEMAEVRDIAKIFDRIEYMKWRSFRESEDS